MQKTSGLDFVDLKSGSQFVAEIAKKRAALKNSPKPSYIKQLANAQDSAPDSSRVVSELQDAIGITKNKQPQGKYKDVLNYEMHKMSSESRPLLSIILSDYLR